MKNRQSKIFETLVLVSVVICQHCNHHNLQKRMGKIPFCVAPLALIGYELLESINFPGCLTSNTSHTSVSTVFLTTGDESRTKLSRLSETLKTELSKYANQKIKPHIEQELAQEFEGNPCRVELDESGEKFFIHYPSAFENDQYVEPKVLLEFGVRNVTIPKEPHTG